MDINVNFPPVLSEYMQSNARYRWILGPFGSGKSVGSMTDIPKRAAAQRQSTQNGKRKSRWAVVRNTMPQLRDTTMKTWFDWFPNGSLGTYKETGKTYTIRQDDIESEVVFRALDDAQDVENLLSVEYTGAYFNEFKDTTREIIEAMDGRIDRYPKMEEGGCSWAGMWGDSNYPEEGSYWERMLEGFDAETGKTRGSIHPISQFSYRTGADWEVFKQPPAMIKRPDGTYYLNPLAENINHLPKGYYERLVIGKTDDFIRTFVLCQYGRSKGGKPVHPMFNRDMHVGKQILLPNRNDLLLVAADFGHTPAIVLKQQNAWGQVVAFDEVVTFGMGIERAIEEKLLPLVRRKYDGFDVFVTGDPSGNSGSDADETSCADVFRRYRHKGLGKVKLAWSNSPVHRQGATDHFLSRLGDHGRPMYQVSPNCEWLIQALGGKFMFKKFKDGRESSEVDKNDWSHIGEANEYGDMYYERGGRRKAELKEAAASAVARPPEVNPYNTPRT